MKKFVTVFSLMLIAFIICSLCNIEKINGFFTDEETSTNKLTIGSVETEIVEENDTKIISPGEEFKKIVKVRNTGKNPCYVRIKVLISPEKYKDELNLDIDITNWEYNNGYYYYKNVLNVNKETPPLFTKLTIPQDLKDGDIFDINIYSEGVQSIVYENDDLTIEDYLTIFEKIS